jgi:putative transposase
MHSIEYRLRGVQFRIKLDKRIGLSIRQVGSPTKNALKSWHGEYEQRLGRPAGYARQPQCPQAQKERAVGRYLDHGRCIAATIRALGHPSRSLLAAWLQDLNPQARTGVVGRSQELAPRSSSLPSSPCACDQQVRKRWPRDWASLEARCTSA